MQRDFTILGRGCVHVEIIGDTSYEPKIRTDSGPGLSWAWAGLAQLMIPRILEIKLPSHMQKKLVAKCPASQPRSPRPR